MILRASRCFCGNFPQIADGIPSGGFHHGPVDPGQILALEGAVLACCFEDLYAAHERREGVAGHVQRELALGGVAEVIPRVQPVGVVGPEFALLAEALTAAVRFLVALQREVAILEVPVGVSEEAHRLAAGAERLDELAEKQFFLVALLRDHERGDGRQVVRLNVREVGRNRAHEARPVKREFFCGECWAGDPARHSRAEHLVGVEQDDVCDALIYCFRVSGLEESLVVQLLERFGAHCLSPCVGALWLVFVNIMIAYFNKKVNSCQISLASREDQGKPASLRRVNSASTSSAGTLALVLASPSGVYRIESI